MISFRKPALINHLKLTSADLCGSLQINCLLINDSEEKDSENYLLHYSKVAILIWMNFNVKITNKTDLFWRSFQIQRVKIERNKIKTIDEEMTQNKRNFHRKSDHSFAFIEAIKFTFEYILVKNDRSGSKNWFRLKWFMIFIDIMSNKQNRK